MQTKNKVFGKDWLARNIRELSLVVVIIVIALFTQVRSGGSFLTLTNIDDMIVETAVLAVMSMGMMMVIITGGIDLSIGATMALSAMTACTVMKFNPGLPPFVIFLLAIAVGTLCGFVIGLLVSRLYILPIIVTLSCLKYYLAGMLQGAVKG